MRSSVRAPRRLAPARRLAATLTAALAGIALVGGSLAVGVPAVAASVAGAAAASHKGPAAGYTTGDYVVLMKGDPAARYAGGVAGFSATTPKKGAQLNAKAKAVKSYTGYLAQRQAKAAASVGATILSSYKLTLNGFSAHLSAVQATELAHRSDVLAVDKAEIRHVQQDAVAPAPSYQYLGLDAQAGSGGQGVWDAVGGVANAGKGIVIGDIDTGISPENPSFAGAPLGSVDGADPYTTGTDALGQTTTAFHKADGSTFTGICQSSDVHGDMDFFDAYSWNDDDCSTKIISARFFDDGFSVDQMGGPGLEYVSARDGIGHGSHTASTAAGVDGVAASVDTDANPATPEKAYGSIAGIAPAAKIAVYKVCWAGWNPYDETDDGCSDVDILAAIEQAVADGVDVINFSIGGGAAETTVSPTDLAFLDAAEAGVFVAASAGNDGPGASTLDNASPWITTVAASTMPNYEATAVVGSGASAQKFVGASITVPDAGLSGTLVAARDAAAAVWPSSHLPLDGNWPGDPVDPTLAAQCFFDTLDPAKVAGKIVLCERGGNNRNVKAQAVQKAGGIGVLLVNPTPDSIDLDAQVIPTIALDADVYPTLIALAHQQPAVTFVAGNTVGSSPATPQIAGFSSRGPVDADGGDILKPDLAAPGVGILADGPSSIDQWHLDHIGTPDDQPAVFTPTWMFASGTSMAAPHVAGLAALYLGVHPNASPAQVKSALMTSAKPTVDTHGAPSTDVLAQGAGQVDPAAMLTPGLVYDDGIADWAGYVNTVRGPLLPGYEPVQGPDLNLPSVSIGGFSGTRSVTRTVTSTQPGTYSPQLTLPGFDVTLAVPGQSGDELDFTAAGQTKTFTLTFDWHGAPADVFAEGALDWIGSGAASGITVHAPLAVRPLGTAVQSLAVGSDTAGSTTLHATTVFRGSVTPTLTGLVRGDHFIDGSAEAEGHSGHGHANADTSDLSDAHTYYLAVPDGATRVRLLLDATSDDVDFDLYMLRLDGQGFTAEDYTSTKVSGHQLIDITDPIPGSYEVDVDPYHGDSDFDVYGFSYGAEPDAGHLAITPGTITGHLGDGHTLTASWHGLEAHSVYEGIVDYGPGTHSYLRVETGDPLPLTATRAPAIVGAPTAGRTLVADAGAWSAPDTSYSYRWLRDGSPVKGATGSSYTPAAADIGTKLALAVTARADGYATATATSASVTVTAASGGGHPAPPAIVNKVKPKITGTASRGHSLTASTGTWSQTGVTLGYRWFAGGKAIAGATKRTLALSAIALEGKKITVTVTAAKNGFASAKATSAAVSVKRNASLKITTTTHAVKGIRHLVVKVTAKAGGPAPAAKPTGKVTISAGTQHRTVKLVRGIAKADFARVPSGRVKVTVRYPGSAAVTAATVATTVKVRAK